MQPIESGSSVARQSQPRVCVLGVGSIGQRHLRCFQATGRVQLALVEIQAALREQVMQQYQVAGFASLEEAFEWRPEIAVVATPAPLHVAQARQLVQRGVHVLIEKPLSTTLEGVEALCEESTARGVTVAVAYVYRCFALFRAVRRALADGRMGRPLQLVAACGQHFPTYRPAYREIYYRDRAQGGGAIQDALTHVINLGEWLVGPVERLVADAAHQRLPGVEVEDTVHVLTRHAGNVLGCYALNQHQAPNEMTITVVCEGGTVRAELHEHRWRWMHSPGGNWHEERLDPLERDTPFIAQAHAFLDAVEQQAAPPCTLPEGLQTLRVNLAALASLEQGQWQQLPSAIEPRC